jgi:hypothetical protein
MNQFPSFANQGAPPVTNFSISFASVVDTTVVNNTGANLPPVSTMPVANNVSNYFYAKVSKRNNEKFSD